MGERLVAALVAVGALAVLALAARLSPDASGMGTHTQMGLAPCGWVVAFNKPCFTCGMTTAFAHAADGDLASSARTQPMGALLAVMMAGAAWAGLHCAVAGSRLSRLCDGLLRPRVVTGMLVLGALAWVYKWATWAG